MTYAVAAKKVVVFVDGENLVMRYQEMVDDGWVPKTVKTALATGGTTQRSIVSHVPNCFVWSPEIFHVLEVDLLRINYYTSVVGDDVRVQEVTDHIARTPFYNSDGRGQHPFTLIPRVHKKSKQSKKSKVVDVDITMDVMRAALTMPIDAIMLLSGDGDYVPLVREVARSTSKQVFVGAFSSGLADGLRGCAERFELLDADFFEWRAGEFDFGIQRPQAGEPTPAT